MFSKSCEYALRALFFISHRGKDGKNVGIKEICDELSLPAPFLAKILQSLVKDKIVSSIKGPHGGFFIPNPKKISLIDIVESIDGVEVFYKCAIGLKKCSDVKPCPMHHSVKEYRNKFKKLLQEKTLDQIIEDIENHQSFI